MNIKITNNTPLYSRRFLLTVFSGAVASAIFGCGGSTPSDTPTPTPPPSVLTRKVQGYITRVDSIVAAFSNIRVSIKTILSGGRAEGDPVVVTPDASGKYVVDLAPGDYTVDITSTDSATAPVQIPITVKQEIATTEVETAGLLPSGVTILNVEFTLPAADGYNGTYRIGQTYTVKSKVVTSGGTFDNWRPLWSVEGGVGSIGSVGDFIPANTGTGKLVARFGAGTTKVVFKTPEIRTSDGKIPAPTLIVSQSATPHLISFLTGTIPRGLPRSPVLV